MMDGDGESARPGRAWCVSQGLALMLSSIVLYTMLAGGLLGRILLWGYAPCVLGALVWFVVSVPNYGRKWGVFCDLVVPSYCVFGLSPMVVWHWRSVLRSPLLGLDVLLLTLCVLWLLQGLNGDMARFSGGRCFPGKPASWGRLMSFLTLYGGIVPLMGGVLSVLLGDTLHDPTALRYWWDYYPKYSRIWYTTVCVLIAVTGLLYFLEGVSRFCTLPASEGVDETCKRN